MALLERFPLLCLILDFRGTSEQIWSLDKPRDSAEELQSFLCISTDRLGFYVPDLLEQLAHENSSVGAKTATESMNGRGISYTLITDRVTEIAPKAVINHGAQSVLI